MLHDPHLARVLYVDLTAKSFRVEPRPDLFERSLGGTGAAIQLLHEECPKGVDPFAPDNPIILAVGPLTAMYPLASKTVAMFKSPLTGDLGESHCGGRSATAIRLAGYGAIVIKGASSIPLYLAVHGSEVSFHDARALWGMRNSSTAARIIRENEPGRGVRTIMRIGRAGENRVAYSAVTTETYRHFGRLGLGAVFGSKKLKALVVSGRRSVPVEDSKAYQKLYDETYEAAVSPAMRKYHDLGTPENVLPLNALKGLPTRNLQQASFEGAENLSGESLAENYLGRRLACSHCPVGCIHLAAFREPYDDEPYFYKTSMVGYDYEPIYSIGALLGLPDAPAFFRLMNAVEAAGVDVMSVGVVLAWATEALQKGLVTEKDTVVKLTFGDVTSYLEALKLIVKPPNDFYRALARGADHAASIYGGQDFALTFGKNEMPGYHTGPAAHLGYLIGARHSHLDNGGYSVDQKVMMTKPVGPEQLIDSLVEEERWRQVLSSLVVCFFSRGIYRPAVVSRALGLAGLDFSVDDLTCLGERIHREKYRFKLREGFDLQRLPLPGRIYQTPAPAGPIEPDFMQKALDHFQKIIQGPQYRQDRSG